MLKLYIYGYLNRIQSSRRLEREAQRNVELMWLTGRLRPDFKTIANFRKDNAKGIRGVCRQFVVLCRELGLEAPALHEPDQRLTGRLERRFSQAADDFSLLAYDAGVLAVQAVREAGMNRALIRDRLAIHFGPRGRQNHKDSL